jgi:hypothetical protein
MAMHGIDVLDGGEELMRGIHEPRVYRASGTRAWPATFASLVALQLAACLCSRGLAFGTVMSCGSDPVANTANVLCAPTSGPCDAGSVQLTDNIQVTTGGCTFDLGGRALTIANPFEMTGTGFITFLNAGDVIITTGGKLKARGDFAAPTGTIQQGGTIDVESAGTITHYGTIDVYGDSGGTVKLHAAGDVVLETGSAIRGLGDSVSNDTRLADGGSVDLTTTGGTIWIDGDVVLNSQVQGEGGTLVLQAARDVNVHQAIDVSGGGGGGGSLTILAGDNISVTEPLDASSDGGGGPGGDVVLDAGEDSLGGVVAGGTLTVNGGNVQLDGSGLSANDDDGGSLKALADGNITFGSGTAVFASAGNSASGNGGSISIDGGTAGDVSLQGTITASGGGNGGSGGLLSLAGRNIGLYLNGDIALNGRDGGGTFSVTAAGAYTQWDQVLVNGTITTSGGGTTTVNACTLSMNGTGRIETTGAAAGGSITLTGSNQITMGTSTHVKATGLNGAIELVTRSFGTCSNNGTIHCLSDADCTVGCSTGTCQNINPDTGGTTAQFDPAPTFVEDPTLGACP